LTFDLEETSMRNRQSTQSSLAIWLPAFLGGLLLGGLAGAVGMWLLAPRAGQKTRSQLQKQSTKLFEQAAESMDDIVTEAGDKAGQFAESVQDGASDLQHRAQGLFGRGGQ
jgi:gas vesicle protein